MVEGIINMEVCAFSMKKIELPLCSTDLVDYFCAEF